MKQDQKANVDFDHSSELLLTFLRNGPRDQGILEDLVETVTLLNDTSGLLSILQ